MDYNIESVDGSALERRITVTIPAAVIDEAVKKGLRARGQNAKIPGFRPGKIPPHILEQKFGGDVRMSVYDQQMRTSYGEALAKEKIRAAGGPTVDNTTMESGKDFEYSAKFEVYPEITLQPLNELKVEQPEVNVGDEDVADMLENLREQRAEWNEVDRAAADGDQLNIDFEGRLDGELFEGGTAEQVAVTLGAGGMIPEFEAGLEGLKAGDEHTYKVNFPTDYHAESLAGKEAEFSVKVHDVKAKTLPEIDEEFATGFGFAADEEAPEDGDKQTAMAKLKNTIKENMQRDGERGEENQLKQNVIDALLAANAVEVPQALVQEEIARLRHDMQHRSGQEDCDSHDDSQFPDDMFKDEASRRVQLGLLMGQVIEDAELKVEPDAVNERLAQAVAGSEKPQDMLRSYRSNPQVMRNIEASVLEQQVIKYITDQALVTKKSVPFKEIANQLG